VGGDHGPPKIKLKSPSGIIHSHLIWLIRYNQHVFRATRSAINKFLLIFKIINFSEFSNASLTHFPTHSFTHSLIHSLTHSFTFPLTYSLTNWCVQSSIAENWLQLQCCSFDGNAKNFVAKLFTILNANVYALFSCSFSFHDISLRWPLLLCKADIKGHAQVFISHQASCIT